MIRAEYQRFLQTLNPSAVPEPVRKIANLVAVHIDQLIPLSTHQGQRIKRIVALSQAQWLSLSPEIQANTEKQNAQRVPFTQLKRMNVGPFRGFARKEIFDLSSRLVLVYGPNGTGKSSFCEALEHGLLGNVAEAESKRFRDQNEYLKNAFVNQFSAPAIFASDEQNNEIPVTANEAAYRFCFVEKNRIDNFSRIAAQAPAKQTELISTLFGLESFNDFVRNFTAEIAEQYIDISGKKATQLALKQQHLVGAQQQIQSNTTELQQIVKAEQNLAVQYKESASYNQMVLELNGNENTTGSIDRLENELRQPISTKSNLTYVALETFEQNVVTAINDLRIKQQSLAAASQQVSFKKLYEAVSQVQLSSPDTCPACKTPLNHVVANPYIFAVQELQKLQQLVIIEQEAQELEDKTKKYLFNISQILDICLAYYPQNNPLKPYQLINNPQPSIQWWDSILLKLPDGCTPWQHLVNQVQQLEARDKQIDCEIQLKNNKQIELNKLREYARKITILQTRRTTAEAALASARQLIDNFQTENAQLIADVEAEKIVVKINQAIASAYAIFVQKLNSYSYGLPAKLIANLGETVVTLYNAFNRNDIDSELLANVQLPLTQNQRLKISFKNKPNKHYDALHLLSEGHIRCLGLAILLAKNLSEKVPVLIFDDPVNAIDDDHKESIRRTLFEDHYFSDKQIILACHGEEFFKDIQNLLPAQTAKQSKLFSFLPRLGEQHIRVDFNCSPRNYILAASSHMERNEIRDALTKSRQALEALTKDKIWRYVNKFGDGNLSLKLRSASEPIGLRNLAEQLKSKIGKADFADPDKALIYGPLDTLVSINGESREWRYLNKGTHEENDRAEFDRHTVSSILASLQSIDKFLENK